MNKKQATLKTITTKGLVWSAIERFSVQGITFIIQLVLARLLAPAEYGIIAMLAIFIQISQILIDGGFANALIQKKNCTEEDFSTVFFFNILIAVLAYGLLFLLAPLIANFYKIAQLDLVLKVLAIVLIINSLSIVQRTQLVKNVDFRSQAFVSFTSSLLSGVLGIILAYQGFGVWALVWQQLSNSFFILVFYSLIVRWRPVFTFSKRSFNELFSFGSKLLVSSLINTAYRNLYSIVIGKKYSSEELGLYSRAEQFALFPSYNIGNIISRVMFPVFSKIQDDNEQLKTIYRKTIQYSSFLIFPLMFGLISISQPFILFFLTEKWSGVIVLLQILCLDWMFDHISAINLNLLYVKGRSDLALKLEIIKKTYAIIILFCTLPFGLIWMCIGRVFYSVTAIFINAHYTNRLIGLSVWQQLKDIIPYVLASAIMAIIVNYLIFFIPALIYKLIVGVLFGGIIYSIISKVCFKPVLTDVSAIIKNRYECKN
jgi:O-antigen/teichoic acid export membrane protein